MKRVVVTHHSADLDALASLIAAAKLYEAIPVVPNFVTPGVRRYLALHKDQLCTMTASQCDDADEVVIVDVRDRRRLKDSRHLIDRALRIVVWDHHPPCDHDVDADETHIEPMGACITLLLEALIRFSIEVTPAEATLFLLGLYSDTGRLSFASTQPRDAAMASWLLEHGANLRVAARYLRHQYSDDQMSLLKALLIQVEEISVNRVKIALCQASFAEFIDGASVVLQQVMEFGGHDVMIGIIEFEKNRRIQVIARSRVSHVDVGKLMRELGGGGHRGAAAASQRNTSIAEIKERIKASLQAMPIEPTKICEMMSIPVIHADANATLGATLEMFDTYKISGAPVFRRDELVGILSRRDIAKAQRANDLHLPVSSHMTHKVQTIHLEEPIEDALDKMTEFDVGRLVVMDEDARVVGIITRSDILKYLYFTAIDDADLVND